MNFIPGITVNKNEAPISIKYPEKLENTKVKAVNQKNTWRIFVSQDFRDDKGDSLLIFIDEVVLSKDARIATIFMTNFSKKRFGRRSFESD